MGNSFNAAANYVVTGARTGDRIYFANATGGPPTMASSSASTMNQFLIDLHNLPANPVVYSTTLDAGSTYVAYTATDSLSAAETVVVELVGLHGMTAGGSYVTLTS